MAGKFKENPEARKRRLEETITAPENDYDNDVAASTKYNDKYRTDPIHPKLIQYMAKMESLITILTRLLGGWHLKMKD